MKQTNKQNKHNQKKPHQQNGPRFYRNSLQYPAQNKPENASSVQARTYAYPKVAFSTSATSEPPSRTR